MGNLSRHLTAFWRDETGEVTVGTILIIALIAIPILFGILVLANKIMETSNERSGETQESSEDLYDKAGEAGG